MNRMFHREEEPYDRQLPNYTVSRAFPKSLPVCRGGVGSVLFKFDENENLEMSKSNDERLLDLTNRTNYNLVQRNGQRIFGGPPPGWIGPAPEKGCEIFVGKVPRDVYEDELVPVFMEAGPIYELRLMMDFSGSNRGYLFVRYTNREDAKRAVKTINNYEIRPGKYLGVLGSVDNRKLWISGIPKNHSSTEIRLAMEKLTDGVRDVILYQSQVDKSKTRGYAFVEYESHRAAALARRKLVPGRIFILGQEIEKVDWAEPENEVDEEIMNKVKVLFIRNLLPATTETKIREIFEDLSSGEVDRVRKSKDYAFVHFVTREAAETALQKSQGSSIEGSNVYVEWSKPVDKNVHNTRKQLTKILSQGMVPTPPMYETPLAQLNGMHMTPMAPYNGLNGMPPQFGGYNGFNRGAPGTVPPRRLVKQVSYCFPGSHGYQGTNYLPSSNGSPSASPPNGMNIPFGGGGFVNNNVLPPHAPMDFNPAFMAGGYYGNAPQQYHNALYQAVLNGTAGNADQHMTYTAVEQQLSQCMAGMTIKNF